ncbi:MAG TPA: NAD(P)-binding domain-containing protein [Polyangiales bacterium]|nr:NAD(P)-binding domain-containing protein [Polyangiales bacterium]
MHTHDVIVIGAGQAGLAISHCLGRRGIDHVVLERGRIGERWRSERWDSLRLLTPNWQSRLPGRIYRGAQPDGFMSTGELLSLLEAYAADSGAPIRPQTQVSRVEPNGIGYHVVTDRGSFQAANVVLATGYSDRPAPPTAARGLAGSIEQLAPSSYKNPSQLAPGGVLVVGASASGVQIADELARSGREVTLAVGRHTRMPRRYRGADMMWWLECIGALDETADQVRDLTASRRQPSLQLIGSDPPRDLDLGTLVRRDVRICGRVTDASQSRVWFADDLTASVQRADEKLTRLLQRIDRLIGQKLRSPAERPAPIVTKPSPRSLDLNAERISSVIWATGFRRDYGFLRVPVLDPRGEIVHARGITRAAGLYVLGLQFQHTRKSSFIDGVGLDAEYIARDIAARLGVRESFAA